MNIRKATQKDANAAGKIYEAAKKYMKDSGNPNQWTGAYPAEEDVIEGIADGTSYVCEEDGEVIGTFYFKIGRDATYDFIEGEWLNSEPYAVIHRIAVKYHGRGIADFIYKECFNLHPNLKIDTHTDNLPMQRSLEKNGFVRAGVIYLANGDPRIAYQKIK